MDKHVETHLSLLIRLTREAHEPNTEVRRYRLLAKAISGVLSTIAKYHGLYYLHYIAYATSLRLGHALGPINENVSSELASRRRIAPNSFTISSQTSRTVYK